MSSNYKDLLVRALFHTQNFKNHETSPPISFSKCSVPEKERIERWKKMSDAVKVFGGVGGLLEHFQEADLFLFWFSF